MALNLNDQTSNGNNLTNNGGATEYTTSLPFATGNTRAAALAQASSQNFTAADSTSLSMTGDFSLGLWVNFASLPSTTNGYDLIAKWATGQKSYWMFFYNSAGSYFIYLYTSTDGTANNQTHVAWTPSTNTWYHVAASYKASTHITQFFVNGTQQGTDQDAIDTSIFNSTASLGIGTNQAGLYFDGRVDDARVYNVTRTGTNWSSDYNTELTGTETGLVAYWPFEALITNPNVSVFDSVNVSESITSQLVNNTGIVFDSVNVSEGVTSLLANNVSVFDSATVAETITAREVFMPNVFDSVNVSEGITSQLVNNLSIFDLVTVAETKTAQLVNTLNVFDSINVSELITSTVPVEFLSVFDSINVSENTTLIIPSGNLNVFDSVTVAETIAVSSILMPNVFDSVNISENVTSIVPSGNANVFDSVSISENITSQQTSNINITDSVNVSENITSQLVNTANVFDSINVSENVISSLVSNVNVLDNINVSETITIIPNIRIDIEFNNYNSWTSGIQLRRN